MNLRVALPMLCSVLLLGCGGGGSGRDLAVDFHYGPGVALLWRPAALALEATGLDGNVPDCSIVDGQLPAGLVVEGRGCRISGTPTEVGSSAATVRMTVSGFRGAVDKPFVFTVVGPPLNYPFVSANVRATPISWRPDHAPAGLPLRWQPLPTENVTYAIASGSLPPGLVLDRATGEIHGILVEAASHTFTIAAIVTGPLGTNTSTSQSMTHFTNAQGLQFFYGPNDFPVRAQAGVALSLQPLFNFGFYLNGANYTFGEFRGVPASQPLPAGMTLDPTTGLLSGVPLVPGTYRLYFEVDLATAGQSAAYASSVLELNVVP